MCSLDFSSNLLLPNVACFCKRFLMDVTGSFALIKNPLFFNKSKLVVVSAAQTRTSLAMASSITPCRPSPYKDGKTAILAC